MIKVDREVARDEGWLFGHYDSRGGASLIVTQSAKAALEHYSTQLAFDEDEEGRTRAFNAALFDLIHNHLSTFIWCDEAPYQGEMDASYGGKFWIGKIQEQWLTAPASEWRDTEDYLGWVAPGRDDVYPGLDEVADDAPPIHDNEHFRYRVVYAELGEDAYGLSREVVE